MKEKELANNYAELLTAKQKATLHPDNKGYEWKYNQLSMLYHDAVLKAKLPKEELAEIEKQGDILHEQHEKEQANQYKERYKMNVLNNLMDTKEEKKYKEAYKQTVLAFLGREQDEKDEPKVDMKKKNQEMAEFESKYGYEKVYVLKKEVLNEISEMDLTASQRAKLKEVEQDLERDRQFKLSKSKKKDTEVEMGM